jgi:hypothetical protein
MVGDYVISLIRSILGCNNLDRTHHTHALCVRFLQYTETMFEIIDLS